jgi:Trypsin-like peptidase domain
MGIAIIAVGIGILWFGLLYRAAKENARRARAGSSTGEPIGQGRSARRRSRAAGLGDAPNMFMAARAPARRGRSLAALFAVVIAIGVAGCGGSSKPQTGAETAATPTVTASQSSAPSDPLAALVSKTKSAVIRIETDACGLQEVGTGFLIGPRLVATVEHVVDGASSIELVQGGGRPVAAGTVVGEDQARDVALIQSSAPIEGKVLQLASRAPKLGESVAALGFPLGLPLTVTQGSVSGLGRTVPINGTSRRQMVQTDAAVNPGNSGGPLISLDTSEVVGLVDLGTNQANGIAFAVSARVAQPLLQAWTTAPQPIPTATCPTSQPSPEASAPAPQTPTPTTATLTYSGQAFTIDYPADWQVKNAETQESWGGTDTTIVSSSDPNTLMRIDVKATGGGATPSAAAQPVISSTSTQPGYQQLDLSPVTLDGYSALHWEFLVTESGVVMRKEDEFIVDTNTGANVAVLTQAPADKYSALAPEFASLRQTLAIN